MILPERRNIFGGSAGGGGYDYQAEAYALIAAKMLAQESLTWADTGCNRVPIAIHMETGTGGDDIRVQLETGTVIEVQAKRGLRRGEDLWSALLPLARAIAGDVRIHGVLITNSAASRTINHDLRQAIERIGQGRTDSLPSIASDFVQRLEEAGYDPATICERLRIIMRDFDQGSQGEQETLTTICRFVAEADQAGAARSIMVADGLDLIQLRGGRDGVNLARLLRQKGVRLASDSFNPIVLREAYLDWMVRTNDFILIPTLSAKLPISSAWIKLRAMNVSESDEGIPKSLEQQIAEYHEWHRLADNRQKRDVFDIEIAARREPHLVIVGGPGAGKSTLLRRVAHNFSSAGQLVLRVSLRAISLLMNEGKTFDDAIISVASDGYSSTSNAGPQMLREARILLADGLDEADPNRASVAEQLRRWVEASSDRKIIVTTRPIGHDSAWFNSWKHLELLPLGSEAIDEYANQVFGLLFQNEAEAERRSRLFNEELKNSRTATIAARNPQLLGFLIALHRSGREISGKRFGIFRSLLELSCTQSRRDRNLQEVVDQAIADRALEFVGWTLLIEPATPIGKLGESLGDLIEQETARPRLESRGLGVRAIEYWVERGILERIGTGTYNTVTFVHMNLRDYAVAQHLRSMPENEFVSWILERYRMPQYREVILLTGGTDRLGLTVATLLGVADPEDHVSTVPLLAADVLGEAENPPRETTSTIVRYLASRIEASAPMVAYETGDRLRSLAIVAPEQIGPLALGLQHHDQKWTREVACTLGLLADPEQYVEEKALLQAFAATSDSGLGERRFGSGFELSFSLIYEDLIIRGSQYLLSEKADVEHIEAVKEKYRQGDFSVGVHAQLEKQLAKRIGWVAVQELRSSEYDLSTIPSFRSFGWTRDWETYRVLLNAISSACDRLLDNFPSCEANSPRDTIARIYAQLGFDELPVTQLFAVGDHGNDETLVEVMTGMILVCEIDPAQAKADALQTLEDLQPPKDHSVEYFPNLRFRSLIENSEELEYEFTPNWTRCNSGLLDHHLLIKALEHPSANIAIFAANLLWECYDTDLLSADLRDSINSDIRHTLAILGQMAPVLWPNEGCGIFLDRLETAATENCAPLISTLGKICKAHCEGRIGIALGNLLATRKTEVVKSALDAIQALGCDDDLQENVIECYRWWLHEGPQDPGPDGKIRVIQPNPAANLLSYLIQTGKATFVDLEEACDSSRSDVQAVAVNQIVRMLDADDELTTTVLDKIRYGHLPSGILDELSRKYPQVCQAHENSIIGLMNSPDGKVQMSVIRALGDGWCNRKSGHAVLRQLLTHQDVGFRNEAIKALRRLQGEPQVV